MPGGRWPGSGGGNGDEVVGVDLRFAYGLTLLFCMVIGYLILLVFRKVTGGQGEISPAKAFWVGVGLLIAYCLAASIIQSWKGSDEPDAVNEERVRRAAEGELWESNAPRGREPPAYDAP
jgi:hypothetical protein